MDPSPDEHNAQVAASAAALDTLTTAATTSTSLPPDTHIHAPSSTQPSHSWLRSLVPTSVLETYEARYHLGNYVLDRNTGAKSFEDMSIYVRLGMHFLYYGYYQQRFLTTSSIESLLRDQSVKMGASYDAPESKSHIAPFIEAFDLQASMADMVEPDPSKYATFNDFFSRAIKPSARPVQDAEDPNVTCCVADCRLTCFPTIDLATQYWIKGTGFTVLRLLGGDDALAAEFAGGSIVIARLAPQDYHRWHSPVSGMVESVKKIPGTYYTVNPQAVNQAGPLDVFCENRRDVCVMQREGGGKVVVIAVGAMLVGSIVWLEGMEVPGNKVTRGECQGLFRYGGSTVITLYPPGEVVLDEDLVRNSTVEGCETLMRVGWRVGTK